MKKNYLFFLMFLLAFNASAYSAVVTDSSRIDSLQNVNSQLQSESNTQENSAENLSSVSDWLTYLDLSLVFLVFVLLLIFIIINQKNANKKLNILMRIERELGHLSASKSGIVKNMDSKFDSLSRELSNLQQDVVKINSRDSAKSGSQNSPIEPVAVPRKQERGGARAVPSPPKVTDAELVAIAFSEYCKVDDVRIKNLSFFSAKMSESIRGCTSESIYRDSTMKNIFFGSNRLNSLEYWVINLNNKMYVLPALSSADAFAEVHPGVFDARGEVTPKTIASIKPATLTKLSDGYSVEKKGELR